MFIAYTFPPVGGAGVQRTTKFVKYLPQFGWDATVLTAGNPSVPVRDESLCRDIPPSTHVVRARTFEPSYAAKRTLTQDAAQDAAAVSPIKRWMKAAARRAALALLQPDPQVLWILPAFRAAMRTLREMRHDVIVASGPPFSSLVLGAALSQATGLPLVLDYRDEWDVSHRHWEHRRAGRFAAALQRMMERYALRRTSLVIATSPRSAARLHALCRDACGPRPAAPVTHIFNGFDPDDFASVDLAGTGVSRDGVGWDGEMASLNGRRPASNEPAQPDRGNPGDRFRIVYTGTLYNLMSPEPLVRAIESIAADAPAVASKIELVIAGRRAADQERRLARLASICRLEVREYVSHQEAIALMRSADALCLIVSDLPGADRIVPAKIFEYMATGRTVLAIAPPGEVWDLLQSHPTAFAFRPADTAALRRWLIDGVLGRIGISPSASLDPVSFDPFPFDPTPFDRRRQTEQLAALLDGLASNAVTSSSLVERLA